jgi:hypothetical protein
VFNRAGDCFDFGRASRRAFPLATFRSPRWRLPSAERGLCLERPTGLLHRNLGDGERRDAAMQSASGGFRRMAHGASARSVHAGAQVSCASRPDGKHKSRPALQEGAGGSNPGRTEALGSGTNPIVRRGADRGPIPTFLRRKSRSPSNRGRRDECNRGRGPRRGR